MKEEIQKIIQNGEKINVEDKIFPNIKVEDLNQEVFDKVRRLVGGNDKNHPWITMSNYQIVKVFSII